MKNILVNVYCCVFLIPIMIALSGCGSKPTEPKRAQPSSNASIPAFVDPEYVCMTQDSVYPNTLIPIEVDNKTYYGCCAGCAATIRQNPDKYRWAVDPLTKKRVDKADAVIVNMNYKALYFASRENAERFISLHGSP